MSNALDNFPPRAVKYGDVLYSKTFHAFNGNTNSISASILVKADHDGVIRPSDAGFNGAVPGKIQFFTANDDGKLYMCGEFDKSGRLITRQHWSITQNPSGMPLLLMLNTDEPGQGAALNLRRSRGTYDVPKTVRSNDSIFKISWSAHDGQSYKESSSLHAEIDGDVAIGNLPTALVFKTFDQQLGYPTDSLRLNSDKSLSVVSLSSLDHTSILLNSPVSLTRVADEQQRDNIVDPLPGTLIFLLNLDTVQVYTKTHGWKSLF